MIKKAAPTSSVVFLSSTVRISDLNLLQLLQEILRHTLPPATLRFHISTKAMHAADNNLIYISKSFKTRPDFMWMLAEATVQFLRLDSHRHAFEERTTRVHRKIPELIFLCLRDLHFSNVERFSHHSLHAPLWMTQASV